MKLIRIHSIRYEISFSPVKGSEQVVREALTGSVYLGDQPSSEVIANAGDWFVDHHSSKLYDIAGKKLAKDDYVNF
jgi:hypothetical protein